MSPKLALRQVLVQPQFVLIEGDEVTDVEHPPVTIPANEWPTYSSVRFPREVKEWQARIDGKAALSAASNRRTRRARSPKQRVARSQ